MTQEEGQPLFLRCPEDEEENMSLKDGTSMSCLDESYTCFPETTRSLENNKDSDLDMQMAFDFVEPIAVERRSSEAPPSSPSSQEVSIIGENSINVEDSLTSAPTLPRSNDDTNTQKKRRADDSEEEIVPMRSRYYLGSILVGNAWSTVRGTGYIKNGEPILIKRETLQNDATSNKNSKKSAKGKQTTLNSMFKTQSNLPQKKNKTNTIVRLTNIRGFEFGRLPTDVSNWVSKLLDFEIISFSGSIMVDCPERLHTGADLLISLRFYILPTAFNRFSPMPSSTQSKPGVKFWFSEGAETDEEAYLRNRKAALQQLFERLELKPVSGSSTAKYREEENVIPGGSPRPPPTAPYVREEREIIEGQQDGVNDEDENDEEILNVNDLNIIYKRAQENDYRMSEMDPCDSFTLKLRPYQKQALHWMYSREIGAASAQHSTSMHPLWSEYAFPLEPGNNDSNVFTDEGLRFYYNPHSGELSLDFPYYDAICRGGILADEMGMGKTIMVSSLIQTNLGEKPEEQVPFSPEDSVPEPRIKHKQLRLDSAFRPTLKKVDTRRSRATLIIAPASLLDQWATELQRSSEKGTINTIIWHGQGREDLESTIDANIDATDVVITSFGTLVSEHSKWETCGRKGVPLFSIEWFRVVLDEAHNIKSRMSKAARAVYDLKAPRRWALTGTPIVNRLEDLYSLLRFLNFEPWSDFSFFRSVVTIPFLNREPRSIEVVQVILESVLLRREKSMKDRDGNMIVVLPDKQVKYEYLEFSPLERVIYDDLYHFAKTRFERLDAKGLIGKRYTTILAMLMGLRRAVLHPSLVSDKIPDLDDGDPGQDGHTVNVKEFIERTIREKGMSGEAGASYTENVLANLSSVSEEECPICMDVMDEPMLLPKCSHKCCKDCILAFLHSRAEKNEDGACPTCWTGPVREEELLEIVKRTKNVKPTVGIEPEDNEDDIMAEMPSSSPSIELRRNNFQSSTKLNALIHHLRRLRDQDPCFRAIVFSQFTSFLDLIEVVLERENLAWYRLDGSTEIRQRHKAIAEFNKPARKPKVFMLSLKVGGVGLNLTSANHVFMMDCWWNEAVEHQAIDRVHRIGQERNVYVTHFIVSDTIESRVLKIQKRKTAIIKEAFKGRSNKDGDKKTKDTETLKNLRIMFGEELGDT